MPEKYRIKTDDGSEYIITVSGEEPAAFRVSPDVAKRLPVMPTPGVKATGGKPLEFPLTPFSANPAATALWGNLPNPMEAISQFPTSPEKMAVSGAIGAATSRAEEMSELGPGQQPMSMPLAIANQLVAMGTGTDVARAARRAGRGDIRGAVGEAAVGPTLALAFKGVAKAGGRLALRRSASLAAEEGAAIGTAHEAARKEIINILKPSAKDPGVEGEFEAALPRIAAEMGDTKKVPPKVQDFAAAGSAALEKQGAVIQKWITPFSRKVVPYDSVGQRMLARLTPEFIESNPQGAQRIAAEASRYTGSRPLGFVYRALKQANNELDALMKRSPSQQRVAINDPEHGYVVARAEALRDLLYENMPEQFRQENQLYGAIKSIRDLAEPASLRARREILGKTPLVTPTEAAEVVAGSAASRPYVTSFGVLKSLRRHIGRTESLDDIFAKAWRKLRYTLPEETGAIPPWRWLEGPEDLSGSRPAVFGLDYEMKQLPPATGEAPRGVSHSRFDLAPGDLPATKSPVTPPTPLPVGIDAILRELQKRAAAQEVSAPPDPSAPLSPNTLAILGKRELPPSPSNVRGRGNISSIDQRLLELISDRIRRMLETQGEPPYGRVTVNDRRRVR